MITPVKNNEIDFSAFEKLIEFVNSNNFEGIFPGSSTGAFTLFSYEKHKRLLEFSRNYYQKTILAGISRNNIEETINLGKYAQDIGVEGVVVITPYYLKFDQKSIFNYYSKIADSLDISIFVYNNPELSGNTIEPETLLNLMELHGNIVGLKDSSSDMRKFNAFLEKLPNDRFIFQGRDDLLYESLLLGAHGGVCGTSNFSILVHELFLHRDLSIHRNIVKVMSALRKYSNHISYNYIFRKKILKEKDVKNYAMFPFVDLDKRDEMEIDETIKMLEKFENEIKGR